MVVAGRRFRMRERAQFLRLSVGRRCIGRLGRPLGRGDTVISHLSSQSSRLVLWFTNYSYYGDGIGLCRHKPRGDVVYFRESVIHGVIRLTIVLPVG